VRSFRPWLLTAFALIALAIYAVAVALPAARLRTHGFSSHFTGAYVLVYEPEQMGRVYDNAWFSARIVDLGFTGVGDIFNIQPPTMTLVMAPLVWLPPDLARMVWTFLGLGWLVAGLGLLMSALGLRARWGLWALPLCLAYTPIYQNIRLGQVYLLLFFLMSLFFWAALRRGDRAAGIILGALLILKSAGAWLWPLLLCTSRRWVILWGGLAAAAIALASLPRVSIAAWLAYVREIPGFLSAPQRYVTAYQTVTSLVGHLTVYDATFNPQPALDWPLFARVATPLLLLAALACSLRWGRLADERLEPRALTLALFLAPAVANAPVGEGYHYTLIVPAIVVACWWAWRARVGPWAWAALALALILLGAPLPYMDAGLKAGWLALLAYPRVYGSYLLWGWLGWALARTDCSIVSGKATIAEDRR
jgi:hypothetical protein